jgi:hypothetical protein
MFKFNIGSAVNGVDKVISDSTVLHELHCAGFVDAEIIKTAMSDTETTYVVTATGFNNWLGNGHEAAVHAVCFDLGQDAIAYTVDGTGYLVGPKAEDWGGAFNPEYFID